MSTTTSRAAQSARWWDDDEYQHIEDSVRNGDFTMPNDAETIVNVLSKQMTKDQLHEMLEAVTREYGEYGVCPFCGCEDMPVDSAGNEIEGDDVSMASEFVEQHDEECFVMLIEHSEKYSTTHD